MRKRISVSQPVLVGRELEYVTDALESNELSFGRYTSRLEKEFASSVGSSFALSCVNGTAALHLAMLALKVRPGDHVLVPSTTFVATAAAVRYVGAAPVFIDVDPHTWTMDVEHAEETLQTLRADNRHVAAIIPVHLYGVPCDMSVILELAEEYNLRIVEDCAEAFGAMYHGQNVGTFGEFGTYSFYGNKNITSGEGGIITTSDAELAGRVALFRGQGMSPSKCYYHTVVGYNYRMSNVLSAIALGQLESVKSFQIIRHHIVSTYRLALSSVFETQQVPHGCTSSNWMFNILIPTGVNRDSIALELDRRGIETRPIFPSIPSLPPYAPYGAILPVSADLAKRGLSLPTHCALRDQDLEYVIEQVKDVV